MRRIWILTLTVFFLPLSHHANALTDLEKCERHLARYVDARLNPWAGLPAAIAPLKAATLVVKIDLSKLKIPLSAVYQMSMQTDALKVPDALREVYLGKTLVYVAHGESPALQELYQRIQESPGARSASFRFVNLRPSHAPLSYPTESIPFAENGDVDVTEKLIRDKINGAASFSVFNFAEDQMVFFVPREQLERGLEPSIVRQLRIKVASVSKAPNSWTAWLTRRTGDLDKKLVVNVGSWAVVSAEAFKRIYELDRIEDQPKVDEDFSEILERCFGISCAADFKPRTAATGAATKPASEDKEMSSAARSRIYDYLKAHRGTLPLTFAGGMKAAFLELGKLIEDQSAAKKYADAIRAIEFGKGEYNSAFVPGAAQRRVMLAWRTFLQATGNPLADKSITAANVDKAISLLPTD